MLRQCQEILVIPTIEQGKLPNSFTRKDQKSQELLGAKTVPRDLGDSYDRTNRLPNSWTRKDQDVRG